MSYAYISIAYYPLYYLAESFDVSILIQPDDFINVGIDELSWFGLNQVFQIFNHDVYVREEIALRTGVWQYFVLTVASAVAK